MNHNTFDFTVKTTRFDENYQPGNETRTTTNFANLARGETREQNLRLTLEMINQRFNALAHWDNPDRCRYKVDLDIISVTLHIRGSKLNFPAIELLRTSIIDGVSGKKISGIVGNNFSSYVRDYDFSILLANYNKGREGFSVPDNFGELHGKLFQHFLKSDIYQQHFEKNPVVCLSVSDAKVYHKTGETHPVLGQEFAPDNTSLTEQYFKQMGLKVRYFMPEGSVAPLAFFFAGDLLNDYSNLELISTISTMETFQKIYRPEIYAAVERAGERYQPSLKQRDFLPTDIIYDREERSQLATVQGKFAEEQLIKPYGSLLVEWSSGHI